MAEAVRNGDEKAFSEAFQKYTEGIASDIKAEYEIIKDEQIIEVLDQYKTLNEKGSHLMEMANIFGGRDNIGIILMWDKGVVNN